MNSAQRADTFDVRLQQYRMSLVMFAVGFALIGTFVIVGWFFGWNSEVILPITLSSSLSLIMAFQPRIRPVRVTLKPNGIEVRDLSKKGLPLTTAQTLTWSDFESVTVKRSGRYAERVRLVLKKGTVTEGYVFVGPPSPKDSEPIRQLEGALQRVIAI